MEKYRQSIPATGAAENQAHTHGELSEAQGKLLLFLLRENRIMKMWPHFLATEEMQRR